MSAKDNSSGARRASSRPTWQLVIAVTSLLVAPACGDGNSGEGGGSGAGHQGGGGGSTISPEMAFRIALGDAYCGAMSGCCPGQFAAEECRNGTIADPSFFPIEVSATTGAFDESAASACLAMMKTAAAGCQPDEELLAAARDACQKVYPGTRQLGEGCTQSADCVAPPFAERLCNEDSKCGWLRREIASQEGEPCSGPAGTSPIYACDPVRHLWCEKSSGTCRAPLGAGEVCDNGNGEPATCVAGHACVRVNGVRQCVLAYEIGEACWPPACDITTDPLMCACGAGLVCDPIESQTCQAELRIGDPCSDSTGFRCPGACTRGRCVERAAARTWAPYCK